MTLQNDTIFYTSDSFASRLIRGTQIADKLGCMINVPPNESTKRVVFVKCLPEELPMLVARGYKIFVDIVDSDFALPYICQFPDIVVMAISKAAVDYIQARVDNKVVYVPEHHCNFDNYIIPHRPVKVAGFVGYKDCLSLNPPALAQLLGKIGVEFRTLFIDDKITREDVVAFYKSIDVQICFRRPRIVPNMPPELKNPLKVINAASFGIHTVSYPEVSYMREFPPSLSARNVDDVVTCVTRLRDLSTDNRHLLAEKAVPYHINNVVDIYQDILGD